MLKPVQFVSSQSSVPQVRELLMEWWYCIYGFNRA